MSNLPAINQMSTMALAMAPRNIDDVFRLAEVLAQSSMVPKDFVGKPGNIIVAMQWGAEIGFGPMQSMQNIAVIQNRPTLWGDALLALVWASGLVEMIDETQTDDEGVCVVQRKGHQPVTRRFTAADAKKAGLWGKSGPWQQYPKRMMQMRARAFALRDVFPDVLKGMQVAEEQRDIIIASSRDGADLRALPLAPDEPLALNPAPAPEPMTDEQEALIKSMVRQLKLTSSQAAEAVYHRYDTRFKQLTYAQAEDFALYLSGKMADLMPEDDDTAADYVEADAEEVTA